MVHVYTKCVRSTRRHNIQLSCLQGITHTWTWHYAQTGYARATASWNLNRTWICTLKLFSRPIKCLKFSFKQAGLWKVLKIHCSYIYCIVYYSFTFVKKTWKMQNQSWKIVKGLNFLQSVTSSSNNVNLKSDLYQTIILDFRINWLLGLSTINLVNLMIIQYYQ